VSEADPDMETQIEHPEFKPKKPRVVYRQILDWLQNVELRRRVNAGLNKGEARNVLARAVFFNRLLLPLSGFQ
jgi:hypothetical protein